MANEYKLENQKTEMSRNIPHEVLFKEILVRLPVKSLTVYKSVCKLWLYTIESRSFREIHRRHHIRYYSDQIMISSFKSVSDPTTMSSYLLPSTPSFVPGPVQMTSRPLSIMLPPEITRINWPNVEVDTPNVPDWSASVRVIGHVKMTGIYCVVAYLSRWKNYSLLNAKISICNPATRDYKLASPFPLEDTARLSDITSTLHCRIHYGFGLAADGDYKVVVVMSWGDRHSFFLSYVYSLKQGAWKKIIDSENGMVSKLDLGGKPLFPEIKHSTDELCPQVFLNGCWHWTASFSDETSNILSFDVDNEVFKLLLGPPSYRGNRKTEFQSSRKSTSNAVSTLNDHLIVVLDTFHQYPDRTLAISVWMMMEYGDEESWINVWTVSLESCPIKTLVGISYSVREDCNGGIHIRRIVFQNYYDHLVSCDEFGTVAKQPHFDTSSCVFWNNLGISDYSETLERF